MTTKQFSTAACLSLTSGLLLCRFEAVKELIDHMVGESVFVHDTTAAAHFLRDELLRQHPELGEWDRGPWNAEGSYAKSNGEPFGPTVEVEQLPREATQ